MFVLSLVLCLVAQCLSGLPGVRVPPIEAGCHIEIPSKRAELPVRTESLHVEAVRPVHLQVRRATEAKQLVKNAHDVPSSPSCRVAQAAATRARHDWRVRTGYTGSLDRFPFFPTAPPAESPKLISTALHG